MICFFIFLFILALYRLNATNIKANPALRLVTSTLVAFMLTVTAKLENANHFSNPPGHKPTQKKSRNVKKALLRDTVGFFPCKNKTTASMVCV